MYAVADADTGYTVTITSVSNIVSFLIAEGIDMRLVAEFAHLSAAGLFGTWVGVLEVLCRSGPNYLLFSDVDRLADALWDRSEVG